VLRRAFCLAGTNRGDLGRALARRIVTEFHESETVHAVCIAPPPMKLASKLAVAFICVMCVVLGLYGFLTVRRERTLFESDMQRDELVLGRALGLAVGEVWRSEGAERALQLVESESRRQDGVRVRWVWLDAPPGDRYAPAVASSELGALAQGSQVVRVKRDDSARGRFYSFAPVALGGSRVGALELSESLEEEDEYIRASLTNTLTTIFALAALSGLLAMGLGAVLVGRPTRALIDKARRIGEGQLGEPLVLPQRDELGQLAVEINAMCDGLAEARERAASETAARIAALEQLRHADRLTTVGKLASGIAHELGTPLNVISGRAKMIFRGAVPEEAKGNARIIVEQVDRMTRIIRQLLDFARRRSAQKAPADLAQIARQTLSFLEPLARKRRVSLRLADGAVPSADGPSPEPSIVAEVDGAQIQQVLTNLVMNGIQAMKSGGELTLSIERTRALPPADHGGPEGDYLAIHVADQGEGIRDDVLPRIFEPFFTTKDVGEGTGLGLSVTYGIVREHGGWIAVESEVMKGSRFTVYLPPGGPAAGGAARDARGSRRGDAAFSGVEDNVA
jgi:two-component system, NtrC family, sensor kinase